jgi:hypothetical protein
MNKPSRAAKWLGLVALISLLAHPAVASAQSAAVQATAEALFTEGRRLLAQGQYADACAKLAESQRLDPGTGTLLNLGDCYEKGGQTASAWVNFRDAAEAAHRAGDAVRERVANQRAQALEKNLATLTITVPQANDLTDLVVKRDGTTMGRAVWGTAAPVDPGAHSVEVTAPGKKPWATSVTLNAAHRTITVSVPHLADALPEPAAYASSTETPGVLIAAPPRGPRMNGQKVGAGVVAAVGITSVGIGALFGALASAKNDESRLHCHENLCDQRGVDLRSTALTNATVSTVGIAVGAVAVAGATVLWFTAPSTKEVARVGLRIEPYAGFGVAGASLRGAF